MSFQSNTVYYFATVLIPELEANSNLKEDFISNYNKLFSGLENDSKQKISLLIYLLSVLSILYTFQRIGKLNYNKRKKFVDNFFSFPYAKVVAGLSGLKSLCFISYYGIEGVWKDIKYEGPIV